MNRIVAGALLGVLLCLSAPAVAEPAAAPIPGDLVVGLSFRGSHRAYPLAQLAMLRVVNDIVGRQEVVVFHDPERNLTTAWFRTVYGEPLEFSGKVAGSIADDLATATRWNMESGEAVGGNLLGQRLVAVPITMTSWERWRSTHPGTALYPGEPR